MVVQEKALITEAHFEDAKEEACALLDQLGHSLIYHRKAHTTDYILPGALKIAESEAFSIEDRFLVGIAAVFHDTGFIRQYNANEPIGAEFSEKHMRSSRNAYTEEHIQHVKYAIENTDIINPQPPQSKYAEVIIDADLSYFGSPSFDGFFQWNEDLKFEHRIHLESPLHEVSLNDKLWGERALEFISLHDWFTDGAIKLFEQAKQRNLASLKEYYKLR